jgi:hypothetical protein
MCIDGSSVVVVGTGPGKGLDAGTRCIERQQPIRVPWLIGPAERMGFVPLCVDAVVRDDRERLAFDLLQHHGVLVVEVSRDAVGGHDDQQAQD